MLARVLYTSLEDVSLPYGPGVNERGFLKDMRSRLGDSLCAVIPEPSRAMPEDLHGLNATFIPASGSVRSRLGWIQARIAGSVILLRTIDRFRPDLIVMRAGALDLPHFFASRRSAVPYVMKTAGDGTFRGFYRKRRFLRPLQILNRPIFDQLMHHAACVDVASPSQRDVLTGLYPRLAPRIHVVDNGVDLEFFRSRDGSAVKSRIGFAPNDFVVGYVGGHPMQRGGREVIDVLAELRSLGNVKGLIVGDSGQADSCREYARDRGVADIAVIYGQADYSEVPDLMASMDVGLSILRPKERHASEMKVRQYLASRLCVVGTAGSNDFLRGHPFARVVETTEPKDVVAAVAGFLEQGSERLAALGTAARAFAEAKLSLVSRNTQRIALWREACSPKSQPPSSVIPS